MTQHQPPSFPDDPFHMDPSNFAGPSHSHLPSQAPVAQPAPLEYLATPTTAGFTQFPPDPHLQAPPHPVYPMQYPAGSSYVPVPQPAYLPPGPHFGSMPNGYHYEHGPPMGYPLDDGGWMGQEWDDGPDDQGDILYGNLEVKHRRRTTPEQLKVLEHWFDINPKPDNNLREWLASELGMTKRNIQVWFQNRRAKVKGLAMKEKAAQAKPNTNGSDENTATSSSMSDLPSSERKASTAPTATQRPVIEPLTIIPPVSNTIPRPPLTAQPASQPVVPQMLLPPVNGVNMGRRVSLANGEAAMIETWVAKRMAAGRNATNRAGVPSFSPRSPSIGTAAAARRSSIPYPPPVNMNGQSSTTPQTAVSPMTRPMPSTLYLAAMRNNTRRASVPGLPPVGTAQLISSAPFTPPRIVSGTHQVPSSGRPTRELSPIKDTDHDSAGSHRTNFVFDEAASDLCATYLTTPVSTYAPTSGNNQSVEAPFAPNAPLPHPGFSFGGSTDTPTQPAISDAEINLWMTLQRGRLGSMASINSAYADSAGPQDGSEYTMNWNGGLMDTGAEVQGFEADARRASAPPDLLHNLGILGLHPSPLRLSPLGVADQADQFPTQGHPEQQVMAFASYQPTTEVSPSAYNFIPSPNDSIPQDSGLTGSHSNASSQSVSPTGMQRLSVHGIAPGQLHLSPNSSISPYDMGAVVSGALVTPAHELMGVVFPPQEHMGGADAGKDDFTYFDGVGAVNVLV